jgi:hypothetical protein
VHCCTEAPSDPYVSLVATYGSSKPCSGSGVAVFLTVGQATSPRRRDDPAPHPLCVVLVDTSTSDVPVVDQRPQVRSPITGVQLVPRFQWRRCFVVTGSPAHVSLLSQPGTRPGIRPVIRETTWLKDPVIMFPAFPFPFGRRHSLLGHPVPAQELGLPHGRLTTTSGGGPGRGCHVPHA